MTEKFADAEKRWSLERHEVYRETESDLLQALGLAVKLGPITDDVAKQAASWLYPKGRKDHSPGWHWAKEARRIKRRPRRLEAAIWWIEDGITDVLCGLVIGRISNNRVMATIHFLESSPSQNNPLAGKVAQIAIRYMELHAVATNCSIIGISNPAPDLIAFYKKTLRATRQITKGEKITRLERNL